MQSPERLWKRESIHPVLKPFHERAMQKSRGLSEKEQGSLRRFLVRSRSALEKKFGKASSGDEKFHEEISNYSSKGSLIGIGQISRWKKEFSGKMPRSVISCSCNPFPAQAKQLLVDALTDSGTSTSTPEQLAMLSEWHAKVPDIVTFAYGGLEPYAQLRFVLEQLFGEGLDFYPAIQGRAAENLLFSSLTKLGVLEKGDVIVSNRPFDTTKGHICANGLEVIACTQMTTPDSFINAPDIFLGNIDIERAREEIEKRGGRAKAILVTVTDNGGGGQPVSMENIRAASKLAKEKGLLFHIDACRIFENALFVKLFEPGYSGKTLHEIAREMLSCADIITISFKKIYSHCGGGVFLNRNSKLLEPKLGALGLLIRELGTMHYGNSFDSYSGLRGDGMIEMISGLYEAIDPKRIAERVLQISDVWNLLAESGVPAVGGAHAVYVDAGAVLPNVKPEHSAAEYLQAILLASFGLRGCALGHRLYGAWEKAGSGEFKLASSGTDSLRYAFPRNTYKTELLLRVFGAFAEAFSKGEFGKLNGGLDAQDFSPGGFYHFGAKWKLRDKEEFEKAISKISGFLA